MKEPKIRFKGFSGEWEEKNITSIASLKAGVSIDTSQEISYKIQGYYPCYGGNGLRGYVRDYTHDGIYNIIGRQGALCGNVKMAKGKFHATEHAVVVTPTMQLDPYFLFNVLTKANINQYATGVAQPGLSVQNINKSLNIYIPDFEEQLSLGAYFQHLDSLIQSTTKKIESLKQVKAASLQSMFPQEGETTPRVRFKGFEGEWEKVKLGDICEKVVRKAKPDTKAPVMMISAANGFVNQSEKYASDNAGKSLDNYTLILKGELCYNHGYSKIRNFGSCFCLQLLEARVPFVYHSFKPYNDDSVYLAIYLNSGIIDGELKKRVSSTARMDGLLNISYDSYMTTLIKIPSYAEQRAIASYFSTLDRQITLQTQRLKKLKQIKSACLDNMFV